MSLPIIAILVIVLVAAWWFYNSQKPAPSIELDTFASSNEEEEPTTTTTQQLSTPTNNEPAKNTFELVDIENPKLRVNSDVLKGTKTMIKWDSKRVHEMRKRFQIMRVLDRMEFHEGSNLIEVYRAVSTDSVSTFVFPRVDSDDEIIELKTQISEDPSDTKSPHKQKHNLDVFKKQDILIPNDMIATIRDLETSYSTRQSSSGPRAIDTHSS
jgi:hypothetical protein